MIFNIIAPELVVFVATCEWLSARALRKRMARVDEKLARDGQFTCALAFFAEMGGFRVLELGQSN